MQMNMGFFGRVMFMKYPLTYSRLVVRIMVLLVCLQTLGRQVSAGEYEPPVKLVAVADVLALPGGMYSICESLDIHNDDYRDWLEVHAVTVDSWVGRRRDETGVSWSDMPLPIRIPPSAKVRIAQKLRIVRGRPKRNWWVRWARFSVTTSRGIFVSNFISSPLKPPGKVNPTPEPATPLGRMRPGPGWP